jgi:hypothetical protein
LLPGNGIGCSCFLFFTHITSHHNHITSLPLPPPTAPATIDTQAGSASLELLSEDGCLSLLIDPEFTFSCPSSLDEVLESQQQLQLPPPSLQCHRPSTTCTTTTTTTSSSPPAAPPEPTHPPAIHRTQSLVAALCLSSHLASSSGDSGSQMEQALMHAPSTDNDDSMAVVEQQQSLDLLQGLEYELQSASDSLPSTPACPIDQPVASNNSSHSTSIEDRSIATLEAIRSIAVVADSQESAATTDSSQPSPPVKANKRRESKRRAPAAAAAAVSHSVGTRRTRASGFVTLSDLIRYMHTLSALCSLLSALCSLLSALCSLLSALCSLLRKSDVWGW